MVMVMVMVALRLEEVLEVARWLRSYMSRGPVDYIATNVISFSLMSVWERKKIRFVCMYVVVCLIDYGYLFSRTRIMVSHVGIQIKFSGFGLCQPRI